VEEGSESERLKERVMVVNTNVSAQSSARLLMESTDLLSKSLARLASGSKIASPEDDVGGMAVSMRFDSQISRLNAAKSNVANAISFSQTQDGFLQKVAKALDRMGELAVLAQDITKSDGDRELYQQEYDALQAYIEGLASEEFNGVSLFSGSTLSVTTNGEGTQNFAMPGVNLLAPYYLVVYSTTINTISAAVPALQNIKNAINQVAADRATVGSNLARLTHTEAQLGVLNDNLTAANSRIKDVDVADESAQFARYNILVQAGNAMLAQANSMPQNVLQLIQ
jgi:flagellin